MWFTRINWLWDQIVKLVSAHRLFISRVISPVRFANGQVKWRDDQPYFYAAINIRSACGRWSTGDYLNNHCWCTVGKTSYMLSNCKETVNARVDSYFVRFIGPSEHNDAAHSSIQLAKVRCSYHISCFLDRQTTWETRLKWDGGAAEWVWSGHSNEDGKANCGAKYGIRHVDCRALRTWESPGRLQIRDREVSSGSLFRTPDASQSMRKHEEHEKRRGSSCCKRRWGSDKRKEHGKRRDEERFSLYCVFIMPRGHIHPILDFRQMRFRNSFSAICGFHRERWMSNLFEWNWKKGVNFETTSLRKMRLKILYLATLIQSSNTGYSWTKWFIWMSWPGNSLGYGCIHV